MIFSSNMQNSRGFTLIELVLAVAIFALMSVSMWIVFDGLIRTKSQTQLHSTRLLTWQQLYYQLNKDITAITPRPIRMTDHYDAALTIDGTLFSLSRISGSHNVDSPSLGAIERVRYSLEGDELWRYQMVNINQPEAIPNKTLMAKKVSTFSIASLSPEVSNVWPPVNTQKTTDTPTKLASEHIKHLSVLPKALQLDITIADTAYQWRFFIPNAQTNDALTGNPTSNLAPPDNNNNNTDTKKTDSSSQPTVIFK